MTNAIHPFEIGDLVIVTNKGRKRPFKQSLTAGIAVVTHVYENDEEVRVAQTGPDPSAPKGIGHFSHLRLFKRAHQEQEAENDSGLEETPQDRRERFGQTAEAMAKSCLGPNPVSQAVAIRMQRAWHRAEARRSRECPAH